MPTSTVPQVCVKNRQTHPQTHTVHTLSIYLSSPTPSLPGLNIIFTIVKSVLDYPEVCQGFFQLYFLPIVEEIFAVVSEASHTLSMYAGPLCTLHHTDRHTNVSSRSRPFQPVCVCVCVCACACVCVCMCTHREDCVSSDPFPPCVSSDPFPPCVSSDPFPPCV